MTASVCSQKRAHCCCFTRLYGDGRDDARRLLNLH